MNYETVEAGGCAPPVQASLTTKDKLLEWLRGERDWDQKDMARECLAEIKRLENFWMNWAPFPVHVKARD